MFLFFPPIMLKWHSFSIFRSLRDHYFFLFLLSVSTEQTGSTVGAFEKRLRPCVSHETSSRWQGKNAKAEHASSMQLCFMNFCEVFVCVFTKWQHLEWKCWENYPDVSNEVQTESLMGKIVASQNLEHNIWLGCNVKTSGGVIINASCSGEVTVRWLSQLAANTQSKIVGFANEKERGKRKVQENSAYDNSSPQEFM